MKKPTSGPTPPLGWKLTICLEAGHSVLAQPTLQGCYCDEKLEEVVLTPAETPKGKVEG